MKYAAPIMTIFFCKTDVNTCVIKIEARFRKSFRVYTFHIDHFLKTHKIRSKWAISFSCFLLIAKAKSAIDQPKND